MGIRQLRCPECGADTSMGLPRDSTVNGISTTEPSDPEADDRKVRTVACPNDHVFYVTFTF
ncbi:transcriptional regulator Brz [Halapricum desulfuricans]|uniref:Zn finger protein n=1 Tax=Halapricum desulfuricans TaxID=2841257 RepID=A0A897MW48_9EURY|nr:transcriptional regulator Brz [Halapricum desulfuricans]QSG04491.1 Zn finger protein [Halapricum desulfuricans]